METKRLAVFGLLILTACQRERAQETAFSQEAVRAVVDKYVASIGSADTELARKIWAERADISFLHPLGHEKGWGQIRTNFYEKLMRDLFSSRVLTIKQVSIKPLGGAAVAEFYWVFEAKWRKDGSALTSQGRETQVLMRDGQGEWRLVHVHYSAMPGAVPNQGL